MIQKCQGMDWMDVHRHMHMYLCMRETNRKGCAHVMIWVCTMLSTELFDYLVSCVLDFRPMIVDIQKEFFLSVKF